MKIILSPKKKSLKKKLRLLFISGLISRMILLKTLLLLDLGPMLAKDESGKM
jgi:hypothetical protein